MVYIYNLHILTINLAQLQRPIFVCIYVEGRGKRVTSRHAFIELLQFLSLDSFFIFLYFILLKLFKISKIGILLMY